MPIWFEVIALMLVAYLVGLTAGWALWGRSYTADTDAPDTHRIKDEA